MNKSLYLRDGAEAIWTTAEQMAESAGMSMSTFVILALTEALQRRIAEDMARREAAFDKAEQQLQQLTECFNRIDRDRDRIDAERDRIDGELAEIRRAVERLEQRAAQVSSVQAG